jgi:hypothetical protein
MPILKTSRHYVVAHALGKLEVRVILGNLWHGEVLLVLKV